MTIPFTFATQTGPIPLSELDANFAELEAEIVAIPSGQPTVPGVVYDGTTDNTVAINAAYAALPSTGGVLYFGPGEVNFTTLSFTAAKPVALVGINEFITILRSTLGTGDAISVNGPSYFSIQNIFLQSLVNRTAGAFNLHVQNCVYPSVLNVQQNSPNAGLFRFDACNFLKIANVQGDSNNNVGGATTLRIKNCGGTINNAYLRVGPFASGGYTSAQPALWITGQTTSLEINNSSFLGGGPVSVWQIAGIVSGGSNFTVTTSVAHDFSAGDFLVLRGASVANYNNAWRIASVTATTIVVNTTLNPGTATAQGTAESVATVCYISNADGAVNESRMSNVLLEAGQPNLYGSAGFYVDGRRGTPGARAPIQGWNLTGVYADFGTMGFLFSGTQATASGDPTVYGFSMAGLTSEASCRGLHFDQVAGMSLAGYESQANQTVTTDRIFLDSGGNPNATEIYIYADAAGPKMRGISITGANAGAVRSYADTFISRSKSFGLFIRYNSQPMTDINIQGNNLFGQTLCVSDDGLALPGNTMKIANNVTTAVAFGTNGIPVVASANTLNILPYNDVIAISGTTNIQTINPAWIGMQKTLLITGALSFITGGNLAILANYPVLAGQQVTLFYSGSLWYIK